MKLHCARWIGLAALVVVTGYAIAALSNHAGKDRVYSVAAARATLTRAPELWVGRTLYVRGRLDGCPAAPAPCPVWQPRLFDPTRASGRGALPVEWLPSDSWLVNLQRIPVLGAFIPAPRAVHWGTVATYRVQVRALPLTPCPWYLCGGSTGYYAFSCEARVCYNAIVLAGAP